MTVGPGTFITPHVRLARPLGQGGMGAVWVADHLTLERQVAVKLIQGIDPSPDARARFEIEAKAAARIQSPHVVQIFDYGVTQGGTPYIIMELLAGESLGERLVRGPLDPLELASILVQAASGLTTAHQNGVVHRDIKPQNIFLVATPTREPFVKVLDFGIAKLQPRAIDMPTSGGFTGPPAPTALPLTATGAIVGTIDYMSPEQLLTQDNVNHATDIWALGVVAYEALTATRPFTGPTLIALSMAICDARYPLEPLAPSLQPWFQRALAPTPERRFASVIEAAEAFRALALAALPTAASTPLVVTRASPAPSRGSSGLTKTATIVAALLAFLAAGAVVVVARSSTSDKDKSSAAAKKGDKKKKSKSSAPASASEDAVAPPPPAPPPSAPAAEPPPADPAPSTDPLPEPSSPSVDPRPTGPGPQPPSTPPPVSVDEKCKQPCAEVGACGLSGSSCYPRSDADCRQSSQCRSQGQCTKKANQCAAGNAADCAASSRCKSNGSCGFDAGGICTPTSEAHCRQSGNCASRGLCSYQSGICMPKSDADCRASSGCASSNACFKNGQSCAARN
jgi:eukaryotic-like serine/threonine-protein kinase